jgi:hypothetical protein
LCESNAYIESNDYVEYGTSHKIISPLKKITTMALNLKPEPIVIKEQF